MKTLMKFWAPWCGPCKTMDVRVKEALKIVPDINFEAINIDESMAVATARGVKSIPTLILLDENGEEQTRLVGVQSVDAINNLLR